MGRAHGTWEDLELRSSPAEVKARGGGDAGTSLTTSNAETALGLRTQLPNPHAPFGFRRNWVREAAQPREHLLC
jgi:hypothetical protein